MKATLMKPTPTVAVALRTDGAVVQRGRVQPAPGSVKAELRAAEHGLAMARQALAAAKAVRAPAPAPRAAAAPVARAAVVVGLPAAPKSKPAALSKAATPAPEAPLGRRRRAAAKRAAK